MRNNEYCYVRNGVIKEGPFQLPNKHKNTIGLLHLSKERLKDLGYYPVHYTCPRCFKHLVYTVDDEKGIVIVSPTQETFPAMKHDAYYALEDAYTKIVSSTYLEVNGKKYFNTTDNYANLLTAIVLNMSVKIKQAEQKEHGVKAIYVLVNPEEAKIILRAMQEKRDLLMDRLNASYEKLETATNPDDLWDIIEEPLGEFSDNNS